MLTVKTEGIEPEASRLFIALLMSTINIDHNGHTMALGQPCISVRLTVIDERCHLADRVSLLIGRI